MIQLLFFSRLLSGLLSGLLLGHPLSCWNFDLIGTIVAIAMVFFMVGFLTCKLQNRNLELNSFNDLEHGPKFMILKTEYSYDVDTHVTYVKNTVRCSFIDDYKTLVFHDFVFYTPDSEYKPGEVITFDKIKESPSNPVNI